MSKKDEALKLALEALNELIPDVHDWYGAKVHRANAAITAIREALAEQPAQQQEPVALFEWLPEGATHIGRISVRTCSGGSLKMSTHAFKYENGVLRVYVTDNDNEYPGWRNAKDVFFHLNFPVLPLYTSPQPSKPWVGLTDEEKSLFSSWLDLKTDAEVFSAIEAKLKEKNG